MITFLPNDTKVRAVINDPDPPLHAFEKQATLEVTPIALLAVMRQHRVTAEVSPEVLPISIAKGKFVIGANKVFIDEP